MQNHSNCYFTVNICTVGIVQGKSFVEELSSLHFSVCCCNILPTFIIIIIVVVVVVIVFVLAIF